MSDSTRGAVVGRGTGKGGAARGMPRIVGPRADPAQGLLADGA